MFTGIIEEVGTLLATRKASKSESLTIEAPYVLQDAKVGDSIAVNGICLTATSISGNTFTADVMAETMRRTSLGTLHTGSKVNLERAMAAGGRFGGHIVSGHIDGTGVITEYTREENAIWVTITCDKKLLKYIIEKGSITIDGISLTVAYVDDRCFKVSIIPHTAEETTLIRRQTGAVVNLENDVIGKYVDKLLHFKDKEEPDAGKKVDMNFLAENGFL